MAFSKSLQKAQFPISCQLCERQVAIKWKCLLCDLLMCENCRTKIHNKFKEADKHRILDIKAIGENTEEDIYYLDDIPCKSHPGKTYCLFCRQCDKLACASCVTTTHKQHDLVSIKAGYEGKIADMKTKQRQLQIRDQEFASREHILEYMRKIERINHEKNVKEAQTHFEDMQTILYIYKDDTITKMNEDWLKNEKCLDNELHSIQKSRNQMDQKVRKLDTLSHPSNLSKCFDETDGATRLLLENPPTVSTDRHQVQRFAIGQIKSSNFGKLQTTKPSYPIEFRFQLSHDFKTKFSSIDCIVAVSSNVLLIKESKLKPLHKVTLENYSTGILADAWGTFAQFYYSYGCNTILIATREPTLKKMDIKSMIVTDSKYCVDPWLITAVHSTEDYKVIIGATNKENIKHAIIFMTSLETQDMEEGKTESHKFSKNYFKREFQSDQISFGEPKAITSTTNKNVFLIDTNQDRVTVLNEGGYVCTYFGNTCIGYEHQFTPTGMTTTPSGLVVLVADITNDSIHILDEMGEFVTYFSTTEIGIRRPCCLDFYSHDNIFIGCATEGTNVYDVKYSEQ